MKKVLNTIGVSGWMAILGVMALLGSLAIIETIDRQSTVSQGLEAVAQVGIASARVKFPDCLHVMATTERVIDGDTIVAKAFLDWNLLMRRRVRILWIDAPERKEPGFNESKDALTKVLPVNEWLFLTVCGVDSFGRWLATIDKPGIGDVGAWLVANGLAEPHPKARGILGEERR